MTDWLLALVPAWGPWVIGLATFFSCLALPIPTSVMMLAAGGFAASGDLSFSNLGAAALGGAILGDQAGFVIGRLGGTRILARLERKAARKSLIHGARHMLHTKGDGAVFLTRWLFSPLGPWVNLIAGAGGLSWPRFTFWAAAGEAVWCGGYLIAGYSFAGNLSAATDFLAAILGLLASGTIAAGLGWLLWHLAHKGDP